MAVDPHHPGDVGRNLLFELDQGASAILSISTRPSGFSTACAGIEEHFRLEHEAVADDPHVRPGAEDLCAGGRKSRNGSAAIPARAGPAPGSAADRDRRSGSANSRSRFSEISSAASIAPSWRRNAAICWLSSSTCASARATLCFSRSSVAGEFARAALRRGGIAGALGETAQPVAFGFGGGRDWIGTSPISSSRSERPVFSSASRSVSWAICAFRRCSAVSLPVIFLRQIELHDRRKSTAGR